MEPKGFGNYRDAKLYMDTLSLDALVNKVFINPVEKKKFSLLDFRIKEVDDKYYVILQLKKIDLMKNEDPYYEVDYDLFIKVLVENK